MHVGFKLNVPPKPPTYNLTTYQPTHPPTHLDVLPTYLPTYLGVLPTYLPTHSPTYLHTTYITSYNQPKFMYLQFIY